MTTQTASPQRKRFWRTKMRKLVRTTGVPGYGSCSIEFNGEGPNRSSPRIGRYECRFPQPPNLFSLVGFPEHSTQFIPSASIRVRVVASDNITARYIQGIRVPRETSF